MNDVLLKFLKTHATSTVVTHESTYNHAHYNTAYGWGNHASAGYYVGTATTIKGLLSTSATGLTYTSATGVLSLTGGYVIPTTTQESNWNSAYGWGNHASAGYAVLTGSTNNTVCTVTGANAIQGEANLIFDGSKLGIAVTPITVLHINDGANGGPATGTTPANGVLIGGSSTNGVLLSGIDATGTFYAWIQARNKTSATYYKLALNPAGGNVGINNTAPAHELDVTGTIVASGDIIAYHT
jgi:hypothetical protein